jgi:hypothetical protein
MGDGFLTIVRSYQQKLSGEELCFTTFIRIRCDLNRSLLIAPTQQHFSYRIALTASAASIKPANDSNQEWTPSEALKRFMKRTESG